METKKIKRVVAILLALLLFAVPVANVTTAEALITGPTGATKLPAPTGIKCYMGSQTLTFVWNKVEGADAYGIRWYDSSKSKYVELCRVTDTSCGFTNLRASTSYKFKIITYDKIQSRLVEQKESDVINCKTSAKATSIKLSAASKKFAKGKSATVKATVSPSAFKDVKWTISDSSVAKISASGVSCKITGLKKGKATLTAEADGKKASCKITVKADSSASAEETQAKYFKYEDVDGGVEITAYLGNTFTDLVIPSKINGKPVVGLTSLIYDEERCDKNFWAMREVTSVTIPNSVTYIGSGAFDGFANLTNVNIPSSVTTIGNYAFCGCPLKSVTIPSSVKKIGSNAFASCHKLTNIKLQNGIAEIGEYAFFKCDKIKSVTIPSSVTSIGEGAFYHCTSLCDVAISSGVTEIGKFAFEWCTSLSSVTLPSSLCQFGRSAFERCTNLSSVTISSGVTEIGVDAFIDCISLSSVTIPSSVTEIGGGAFSGCTNLSDVTISLGVTEIGVDAFRDCTSLSSVTLPSSVTKIGGGAFSGCTNLSDVTISPGVTEIGEGAFRDCTSLSSVTLPSSVTKIGEGTFYNCTSLSSIEIPSDVRIIEAKVFYGCTSLSSVTIPSGILAIGDSAFADCISLSNITIPSGDIRIYRGAFSGCENIAVTYKDRTYFYGNLSTMKVKWVDNKGWMAFINSLRGGSEG